MPLSLPPLHYELEGEGRGGEGRGGEEREGGEGRGEERERERGGERWERWEGWEGGREVGREERCMYIPVQKSQRNLKAAFPATVSCRFSFPCFSLTCSTCTLKYCSVTSINTVMYNVPTYTHDIVH